MSTLQKSPGSTHSDISQSWRKRPANLVGPAAHPSAKRIKQTSSAPPKRITGNAPQPTYVCPGASTRSSSSRAKAERWFDDTNEHPKDVSFVDNDPPYYMKNGPSDCNSVCATQSENSSNDVSKIGPTAPTRSLLAQMDADNDNGEAYRSVIDDLTVQNKRLKRKLRKFEVLHCSHLQEEKLFEVRIHGLAANRKRELEETLRSFASSIDEDSPRRPGARARDHNARREGPLVPLLHKTSSSSTSASKPPLDSTYASMSGVTGAASQSHPNEHHSHERGIQANCQNVKSYLHDIPGALVPQSSTTMSDRSKSKAIVRRLEQLFTGKGAASRSYGQSQQQQEVSQSAALASGQHLGREGTREAPILSHDAELQVDAMADVKAQASSGETNPQSLHASQHGSPRSPEQRPTRPLDLDLHRAQVPSDNMEYLRHLGLSSTAGVSASDPESKDGWVYLNLLTSMAQLHTLNVTPEFIRKAVADVSSKFELSSDQTKVRWMGGSTGTRMSSDGDESEDQLGQNPEASNRRCLSRDEAQDRALSRAHPTTDPIIPEIGAKRRPINFNATSNEDSSFQYRPLFFHTAVSEEDGSDIVSQSTSSSGSRDYTTATGMNSGPSALRYRVSRFRGRRKHDGPMIFYNGAKFCTDLSGDLNGAKSKQSIYRRFTRQPVGSFVPHTDEFEKSDEDEVTSVEHGQPSSQVGKVDIARSALNLDDLKSVISDYASDRISSANIIDMEASGLGGIQPEDNFVVKVQVRHGGKRIASPKLSSFSKPKGQIRKILHNVPRSSIDTLRTTVDIPRSRGSEESVNGEIISTVKTEMPPSALPPPSYVHLPLSSSSGSESDDEEEEEESKSSLPNTMMEGVNRPHHAMQRGSRSRMRNSTTGTKLYGKESRYSSPTSPSDESDSGSDDSSIDLLAHARGFDPETIAAREREFESNEGDLARAPAKCSPAKAGGGGDASDSACEDGEESDIDSMSVDGDESDDSE